MSDGVELEKSSSRSRTLLIILGVSVFFLVMVLVFQVFLKPKDEMVVENTQESMIENSPVEEEVVETSTVEEVSEPEGMREEYPREEYPFVRRDPNDSMAIGAVDAPVVMTEWMDLRCPYCALFARQTLPLIIEEFVDTGQLRIEFVDVSYFGQQSTEAAVAARAAAEQGLFFEYITEIYSRDEGSGHQDLPREKLIEIAEAVKIPDMKKFEADLDSKELREEVELSTETSHIMGVDSVPFFVIRSVAVSGSQPIEVFREFIQEAVEETQ